MTPPTPRDISRREALRIGVAAAGALALFPYRGAAEVLAQPPLRFVPNVFLEIDGDGRVTITVPRPEMGQGVRTSLPMLVADELGCSLDAVSLRQADFEAAYGDQYVGGSNSVRGSWEPLRIAGAAARAMLCEAAAARWGVPATECDTRDGHVLHSPTARALAFGSLVSDAMRLEVPKSPALRAPGARRIIGGHQRALDTAQIARGEIKFGLDVRRPGMLVATIERAPTLGAAVRSVNDTAARAASGVRHIVTIDPRALPVFPAESPKPLAGVAIVAASTWESLQARRLLRIDWEGGSAENSTEMRAQWAQRAREAPRFVERSDGNFDEAFAAAARKLEALYEVPFLAHATMEPMNCVADVRATSCEVWAPTQNPEDARDVAAAISGLAAAAVRVHPMRMGGGFGRRFYSDFVAEAVCLSKAAGAPVQVVWTREDDIRNCLFRPAGAHWLRGAIAADGTISAWSHHLANASRGSYLQWKPPNGGELHPGEIDPTDFPANFIRNFRLGYTEMPTQVPRGQLRAVEDSANVFVIQGFLDELAVLAHRDPLDLQLELLSNDIGPERPRRGYDAARLRAVFALMADRSGWRGRASRDGRAMGIAGCFSHGAYVAESAEVELTPRREVRVRKMVVAVDCGTPVNRLGIEAQVRGAIVYGLSAALHQQITVRNGRIEQGNFNEYPPLRIHEMPEIEVHIVDSSARPSGMGEGALSPAAPAVTNAIFALTGQRIRRLPIEIA